MINKIFDLYIGNMILTPDNAEIITEVKGINPTQANLVSGNNYAEHGAVYQGYQIGVRNIVLEINIFKNVTQNRDLINALFAPGNDVTLKFVKDQDYFIDGVVETVNYERFVQPEKSKQFIQVSIMCYDPFFYGEEKTQSSLTVDYNGTAPGGFELSMSSDFWLAYYIELRNGSQIMTISMPTASGLLTDIVVNSIEKTITGDGEAFIALFGSGEWLSLLPGTNTVEIIPRWEYEPQTVTSSIKYRERFLAV